MSGPDPSRSARLAGDSPAAAPGSASTPAAAAASTPAAVAPVSDGERAPERIVLPRPELIALLPQVIREGDIARKNRVYVNRNLRMDQIDLIGFDMDYTLAIYNQPRI